MWLIWKEMAEYPITRRYMLISYTEGVLTTIIITFIVLGIVRW